jgi:hypothetical protein
MAAQEGRLLGRAALYSSPGLLASRLVKSLDVADIPRKPRALLSPLMPFTASQYR